MDCNDKLKSRFSILEKFPVFLLPFLVYLLCAWGLKPLYAFDMASQFIIYLGCLRKAFFGGYFPFWEPLWAGGYPFAADPQTLSYYPPGWVAAILFPPKWAATFLVFAHSGVGALGIWLFIRRLLRCRYAAWFSAIVYCLGGYATGHLLHLTFIQVLGLFPITLHLVTSEEENSFFGWKTFFATLCFALIFLAGHPQSALMVTGVIIIILISFRDKRLLVRGFISIILGILLSLTGVLSFRELATQSVRASFSYEAFTEGSMHPIHLLLFLSPSFFGSLGGVFSPIGYWGGFFIQERIAYLGFIPLVLGITACAIGLSRSTPWRRYVRILFVMVIVGAFLSCSKSLGIAGILYRIPLLNRFRVHSRYIFLSYVGFCFLAPMGLLALCGKWPGIDEVRARKMCLAIALILIGVFYVFCMWGLISPETFPGIEKSASNLIGIIRLWNISNLTIPIPSLICLILIVIIRKRRSMFQIALPIIIVTMIDVGLMRYDLFLRNISPPQELSPLLKKNVSGEGWTLIEFPYLLPDEMKILYPNHPLEHGGMVLNQYNPLILRSISRYLGMDDQGRIANPRDILKNRGLCSAFGIRRAVLCKQYRRESDGRILLAKRLKPGLVEAPQPPKIGDFRKTLEYKNLWIGADESAIPFSLAYIPRRAILGNEELILDPEGPSIQHRVEEISVIHENQGKEPGNADCGLRNAEWEGIMENGKGEILREWQLQCKAGAEIDAEAGTFIIFRILDYPGWRLTIDGKHADFLRANGCFLGVRALKGRHNYEWRFRPTYLKPGIYLCIAAFVIMALLLLLNRHIKSHPGHEG